MTLNIFDGTGWVHVEGHGWLYRQGDGHVFSHTAQKWVYLPHLLTPQGDLTEPPPPIPTQARARHAAGRVATRLTTGTVLPLASRQPLVGRLPRTPNEDKRARPFIAFDQRPAEPEPGYADDNFVHAHGWPTWEDAWGYEDMRPGGLFRALLRGYTRFWMYLVLPLGLLSAFGGGDAFAGGLIAIIGLGVPVLVICVPLLYILRSYDFDKAKGNTALFALAAVATIYNHTHPRRPMPPSFGTGQFNRPAAPQAGGYANNPLAYGPTTFAPRGRRPR